MLQSRKQGKSDSPNSILPTLNSQSLNASNGQRSIQRKPSKLLNSQFLSKNQCIVILFTAILFLLFLFVFFSISNPETTPTTNGGDSNEKQQNENQKTEQKNDKNENNSPTNDNNNKNNNNNNNNNEDQIDSIEMERLQRGVLNVRLTLYLAKDDFQCLQSNMKIPRNFVNDNYCDCSDGSDEPGTNACKNGKFYCHGNGIRPKLVASSFVNDGICDCCDGADEYLLPSLCKNTCKN